MAFVMRVGSKNFRVRVNSILGGALQGSLVGWYELDGPEEGSTEMDLFYSRIWDRLPALDHAPSPKFKVGDPIEKPKGYKFDGEIRSVFTNKAGDVRVVAENGEGMLHIFNEGQLEPRSLPLSPKGVTFLAEIAGVKVYSDPNLPPGVTCIIIPNGDKAL